MGFIFSKTMSIKEIFKEVKLGSKTYIIDIHGEEKRATIRKIQKLLSSISNDYGEVKIIHGYREGNVLQRAVRNELKHFRIKQKILTMNQGETIFLLNKKKK